MSDLLPVVLYTAISKIPGTYKEPPDMCPICREKYEDIDMVCFLDCKHLFHYECISLWIDSKGTCPCCRNEDIAAKISKEYRTKLK